MRGGQASELSGVSSLAGIATGLKETKAVIERTMAHELMEVRGRARGQRVWTASLHTP